MLLTARDMVQTGRWIEPHYKGESRLRKPPLMYWLVGGLYQLGAPVTSAAWSRLPSAVAGIGFVCILYALGRRLAGRRRAFAAAMVAVVSVIMLRQAKLAETDMCLSLFAATSALAGALALRGPSARWWVPALACAGIGFMIKGPAAVTLPPVAWLAFAWWRRWRVVSPFRQPAFWLGLGLCVGIAAPWYLAIHARADAATDAQVRAEMAALLTSSKHTGPFYYYVYTTLHALAPWSLLLPVALWQGFRLGRNRTGWGFPLVWFTSSAFLLSCLSSKQIHYATLLVAPGALVVGCALHARHPLLRNWGEGLARLMTWLLLAGGLVVLGGLLLRARPIPVLPAALSVAGLLLAALSLRRPAGTADRLAVQALILAALLPGGMRVSDTTAPHGTAARWVTESALRAVSPEAPIVCLGPLNTTAAFYADRPVRFEHSLAVAWSNAVPGTLILATWHDARSVASERFPAAPLRQRADRSHFAAAFLKPGGQ